MRRALQLAALASGQTSPNPLVGAVLVADGDVVGEGYHRQAGAPHAEIEALRQAGARARGATLFVTLEPCNHHGKTPPCAPALLAAGVRRVVAAVSDPNPHVAGGGLVWLRHQGIETSVGCLESEARFQNRFFFTWAVQHRPFITAKYAMTLDGKIACHSGSSQWITGPLARQRVHQERAAHDAVLVGIGTVVADDPLLTVRLSTPAVHSPLRIVLDSSARLSDTARMLREGDKPPLVVVTAAASSARRQRLERAGAEVVCLQDEAGPVDLRALLACLADRNIQSVLVEGGSQVYGSFWASRTVDRVLAFMAPLVVGGATARGPAAAAGTEPLQVQSPTTTMLGNDLLVEGDVMWNQPAADVLT